MDIFLEDTSDPDFIRRKLTHRPEITVVIQDKSGAWYGSSTATCCDWGDLKALCRKAMVGGDIPFEALKRAICFINPSARGITILIEVKRSKVLRYSQGLEP